MNRFRPTARRADDQGFTLVEVIVAIVLLAMVSVAMLGLFIRAVKDSAGLDRRQAAVGVANEYMEFARSIPPQKSLDKLVSGRTQTEVSTEWAAATGADLSQTDMLWDAAATASSADVLPVKETKTVGGITYVIRNLVGSCWRPASGGDCVKAVNKAADSVQMYRIIVHVSWSENANVSNAATCSGGACTYSLASLVDISTDPSFNIYATNASWPSAPVLTALGATTPYNTPVTVNLANAVVTGATPLVASVGTPTQGASVSVLVNTTTITVTPANGFSGAAISVPFTLTDPYGQSTSSTLSVTVTAPPFSVASFTLAVPRKGAASVNLAAYVTGAVGTVSYSVPATTPRANLSMSGSVLTYTRKNNANSNESFTFTVTTTSGQSATGTVTINVY